MFTSELSDYIKQSKAVGQTDEQIKGALLKSGWQEADIQEAFDPKPSVTVNYLETLPESFENKLAHVNYSGFWIRFLAILIDWFFLIIPGLMLRTILLAADKDQNNYLLAMLSLVLTWAYFSIMTLKYQATIGKMIIGLKVVSEDLMKPSLAQVIIRETIGKLASSILYIGYIMVAFTKRKQGLHDMIAKTYVIHKD